jgi:hypothetical protein
VEGLSLWCDGAAGATGWSEQQIPGGNDRKKGKSRSSLLLTTYSLLLKLCLLLTTYSLLVISAYALGLEEFWGDWVLVGGVVAGDDG